MKSATSNSRRLRGFRRGRAADVLLFGVISCILLWVARQHTLAAMDLSLVILVVGGFRLAGRGASSKRSFQNEGHQDGLTGIANRAALEARVEGEWQRVRRASEPTALLLVRVDSYPQLRKAGGEIAAQVSMLTLARVLSDMLPRASDLLARYDESTFAILLPGTDMPGALRVASRLRWSVVRLGIEHPGIEPSGDEPGTLTVSMGLAVQSEMLNGAKTLITAAEDGLAKAMARGRDGLEHITIEDKSGLKPGRGVGTPAGRAWKDELQTAAGLK